MFRYDDEDTIISARYCIVAFSISTISYRDIVAFMVFVATIPKYPKHNLNLKM